LQQGLVGFTGAGIEIRIAQLFGVLQAPGRLLRDRGNLVVHVENLALVHAQRLDAVLVGVGVDRFLEGLAQNVLTALGVGDQAIHGQHQIVGDKGVGRGEEAKAALDDQALVVGQAGLALPQSDVRIHVHFLRHPVVGATIQVLLPGPVVLEGHQLVEVGAAVDHALVVHWTFTRLAAEAWLMYRFSDCAWSIHFWRRLAASTIQRGSTSKGGGEQAPSGRPDTRSMFCTDPS
jgi:hypothetical protein